MNRRSALAAIVAATAAGTWFGRAPLAAFMDRRRLRQLAETCFGAEIADNAACRVFLADYGRILPPDTLPQPSVLTAAFLRSSNLVLHNETGAPLEYDGLFDPYESPCANRLTAGYAA